MNAPDRQTATAAPSWFRWAQLVRLPTVFTVIAQVTAAFLMAAGGAHVVAEAWPRLILILFSAVAVYWSGMIFNDLWDIAEDTRERPWRPLPSGAISIAAARAAAWGLMALSILLATISGTKTAGAEAFTFAPAVIASALAIGVVLYNGPLKPTPFAPLMMGICRMLCFLLGAAPLMIVGSAEFMHPQLWFPLHILAIAAAFGVYITGITTISRRETDGDAKGWDLATGLMVTIVGAALLAVAPRLAPPETRWMFLPDGRFALLIGLITLPVVIRGVRAATGRQAALVQHVVRVGILNVIPYSAALAMVVAGIGWAVGIFALAFLATITAARFRVT